MLNPQAQEFVSARKWCYPSPIMYSPAPLNPLLPLPPQFSAFPSPYLIYRLPYSFNPPSWFISPTTKTLTETLNHSIAPPLPITLQTTSTTTSTTFQQQREQHHHNHKKKFVTLIDGFKQAGQVSATPTRHPRVRVRGSGSQQGFERNKAEWRIKSKAAAKLEFSETDACNGSKTTLMIRNIPNKFREMLLVWLDNHCVNENKNLVLGSNREEQETQQLSAFDFLYLPMDFESKCNLGYAFVNFTNASGTLRLFRSKHKQPWDVFGSKKICEICYAKIQGTDSLMEHFRNSKFACESDEYLPVRFSPHRNGSSPSNSHPVGSRTAVSKPTP